MLMHRYRNDLLTPQSDEFVPSDKEEEMLNEQVPMDEFEALIDQQIAASTMTGISRLENDSMNRSAMDAAFDNLSGITSFAKASSQTPKQSNHDSEAMMFTQPEASQPQPKSSQPKVSQQEQTRLSDDLKARIAANKQRAMALLEVKRAEQKKQQEEEEAKRKYPTFQGISEVYIDDDFDL